MSAGAIVGITIAVLALVAFAGAAAVYIKRRRKRSGSAMRAGVVITAASTSTTSTTSSNAFELASTVSASSSTPYTSYAPPPSSHRDDPFPAQRHNFEAEQVEQEQGTKGSAEDGFEADRSASGADALPREPPAYFGAVELDSTRLSEVKI